MREVNDDALKVVHPERAHRASCVLRVRGLGSRGLRVEHGVVHDELRTTVEQLLEGLRSSGAIEHVRLCDALPRKVATPGAEFIAQPSELLLFCQQYLALCDPLLMRNDFCWLRSCGAHFEFSLSFWF